MGCNTPIELDLRDDKIIDKEESIIAIGKGNLAEELYKPETKDFLIVETDASDDTWAGYSVLLNSSLQVSSNEQTSVLKTEKYKSKLCKYISGTFSETEQKYSTHEKETLACLQTLKKWKIDLLQTRFELRTDSKYRSTNPLATTTTPISPIYQIHQKQQQHLSRYPYKRIEGILKQAQHHLQQKREQIIYLEKQLAIAREEEEKLANTVQCLTQTTNLESTSESTPSPSTPIKSRPSKTQESESPSSRKNEFIKIEEDVEEIIQFIQTEQPYGNFKNLPMQVQNIIKTYNALFARNRPLYFKLHSSYPVFDNNDHKLLVPSFTLAELGVSNEIYPPKNEPRDNLPPAIPSPQNLVDALAGVFLHH
ncbi:Enzymatic polyprotein [Artemisia annua]|uniref:Enzymatic polyprotein n=1 Tax=Artemisia annua TaxID=35608 RepID=A0A2U1PTG6_ARTAN|nr:Enzymatic polyprotein [Artemisia annua]